MSRRAWYIALWAILGLASLLRFWAIQRRGLIYWDEGKFTLEGMRLYGLLFHHSVAGKTIGTAKPTHALLIALSAVVLGPNDVAPVAVNAFCSVLLVAAVALIGIRLFDRPTAVLIALLLAASEYEVVYARSALSESDAALAFFAALLVYLRYESSPGWRRVAAAGSLGGLAFTINYRLVVYVVALVLYDAVRIARSAGMARAARRALVWGTGFLVVPLLWELVDLVARAHGLVLFRSELTGRPELYLQEAWYQLHQGRQARLQWNPVPYLQWYLMRMGPIALLLSAGAVVVAAYRPHARWVMPSTLVVVPLVLFSLAPFTVPRNTEIASAISCILVGAALMALARRAPSRRLGAGALAVVTVLGVLFGVVRAAHVIQERSGFKLASQYVRDHGSSRAFAASELLVYYLADAHGCNVLPLPASVTKFRFDESIGYRFVILDHTPRSSGRDVVRSIKNSPIAAHISLLGVRPVLEDPISYEDGNTADPISAGKFLRIYRLEPPRVSVPRENAPTACDLNRVL